MTIICLFLNEDPARIALYFNSFPFANEQVLKTFAAFIHVKSEWINGLIIDRVFELLFIPIVLSQNLLWIRSVMFVHFVIYLPSAKFAYISNNIDFVQWLVSLNAQVKGNFLFVPLMVWINKELLQIMHLLSFSMATFLLHPCSHYASSDEGSQNEDTTYLKEKDS